jgi:branched-chain amino acid aminotransferase
MAVTSFEWTGRGLAVISHHHTFAAGSAALPEGAYTTFRTYRGRRIVRLPQHVGRLKESADLRGTPGDLKLADVKAAVRAALDATRHDESRFRLTFAPPRLFVGVEPFHPPPARAQEEGVSCVTVPERRENPHAKDTRFIATATAAYAALPAGIEEGLMLAEDGVVLEGLSSNFFAVRGSRLWTEEERVLHGVTRALVLEVAATVLPVERTGISLDPWVTECFITSVSREVMPVVRVDGRLVGDGRPGPVTREIATRFAALVERDAEPV